MNVFEFVIEINVDNRPLSIYDFQLEKYKFVNKADLSSMDLLEFPAVLGNLKALEKLNLNSNRISLCKITHGLELLKELHINANSLTSFPINITTLKSLNILNISVNDIHTIPKEIERCSNLVKLDLSKNSISSIPDELFKLKKLKFLNLSDNKISQVPLKAAEINLYSLNLSCNHIMRIDIDALVLEKIPEFNVSFNPISYPPPKVIKQGSQAFFKYLADESLMKQLSIPNDSEFLEEVSSTSESKYSEETEQQEGSAEIGMPEITVTETPKVESITKSTSNLTVPLRLAKPRQLHTSNRGTVIANSRITGILAKMTIKAKNTLPRLKFRINELLTEKLGQIFSVQDIETLVKNGDILCLYILKLNKDILDKKNIVYSKFKGIEMIPLEHIYAESNIRLFYDAAKIIIEDIESIGKVESLMTGDLVTTLNLLMKLRENSIISNKNGE